MKVSEHLRPVGPRTKKAGRHRVTYRAARRNLAKIAYRLAKRRAR
jgi:hypothetical protein